MLTSCTQRYGPHKQEAFFIGCSDNSGVEDIQLFALLCSKHCVTVSMFQVFTPTALKKGDLLLADVSTQIKRKNVLTDLKVDTASNVSYEFNWISCNMLKTVIMSS